MLAVLKKVGTPGRARLTTGFIFYGITDNIEDLLCCGFARTEGPKIDVARGRMQMGQFAWRYRTIYSLSTGSVLFLNVLKRANAAFGHTPTYRLHMEIFVLPTNSHTFKLALDSSLKFTMRLLQHGRKAL